MQKILLIHSDSAIKHKLTFLLQHSGFKVADGSAPGPPLVEIDRSPPDLVVMAEGSRKFNGDELCIRVREISDAPIIILGQDQKEAAGIDFLKMGADVYLTFPLDARELLAYVHSLLRRRQMQQSVKGDSKEQ